MPKKKTALIRFGTIKNYIKNVQKMYSSKKAVTRLIRDLQSATETVITEATKLAKEDKRKTVMEKDVALAIEKHLGKKRLTWQETAEEIIQQNPADLGKISKAINDHIEKEERG